MDELELLRRLVATTLPAKLHTIEEIEAAGRLKDRGFIDVAIPPKSKGKESYGQQEPAIVRAITSRGNQAASA
jgi:hypothetical protein